jgi:hypothetical protein
MIKIGVSYALPPFIPPNEICLRNYIPSHGLYDFILGGAGLERKGFVEGIERKDMRCA